MQPTLIQRERFQRVKLLGDLNAGFSLNAILGSQVRNHIFLTSDPACGHLVVLRHSYLYHVIGKKPDSCLAEREV